MRRLERDFGQTCPRFILLGGFLGAGKTTALLRLAGMYVNSGRRVGIITNDQSDGLVDTEAFRAAGFKTEEVPKGCFCCRFDELIAAAGRLADGFRPDLLLAEPVGSCTDLVATVINPLRALYADRFSVAPYVALLDPERAWAALTGNGRAGFSAKVTYLFKMQQHEADIVAINKVDKLSLERRAELRRLIERNFPKARMVEVSARSGEGFDQLFDLLNSDSIVGVNVANVDYDLYAEAEARLGWLNASLRATATEAFNADSLLLNLAEAIQQALREVGVEPAHVKMILQAGASAAVVNVINSQSPPELSQPCGATLTEATIILNARVEADPELLRRQVQAATRRVETDNRVSCLVVSMEALAPGRPMPTHRLIGATSEAGSAPDPLDLDWGHG